VLPNQKHNGKVQQDKQFVRQADIAHSVPGRLRLRLADAKGDAAWLEELRVSLLPSPGVLQVSVNPATGSVLLHYDIGIEDFNERLAEHAGRQQLFTLRIDKSVEKTKPKHAIISLLEELRESTLRETGGMIDIKEIFPLAIGLYDLFFVKRSRNTPLWLTLLMFSFSSYIDLHKAEPEQEILTSLESLRAEIAALRKEIHIHEHEIPRGAV
jgi:hypothetical protein